MMNSDARFASRSFKSHNHPFLACWIERRFCLSAVEFSFAHAVPTQPLASYVAGFWEVRGDLGGAFDRILPTIDAALVLNLGDAQRVADMEGNCGTWSNAWIAGPRMTPLITESPDRTWICGARLTIKGAHALGVAPNGLIDSLVDVRNLDDRASHLVDLARACPTAGGRFDLLARTIWRWAEASPEWSGPVEHAVRAIRQAHGRVRVEAIASDIGWSRQRLHRTFIDFVGISPKSAARLFRFRHAIDLIGDHQSIKLPEIAAAAGYFDQSHFTRDFSQFSGMTPGQFLDFRTPGTRGFAPSP